MVVIKRPTIIKREINQGFSLKNLENILNKNFKFNKKAKDVGV
jgi:hypothetical protein